MGKVTDIKKGRSGTSPEPDDTPLVPPPSPELAEQLRQLSCHRVMMLILTQDMETQSSLIDIIRSVRRRCQDCKDSNAKPCGGCTTDAKAFVRAMTKTIMLAECLKVATGPGSHVYAAHSPETPDNPEDEDQVLVDILALHKPKYSQ